MSAQAPDRPTGEPIQDISELVSVFVEKASAPASHKVGLEHEKIGVQLADFSPLPFDGPHGIEAILRALAARFGWQEVFEQDRVVALTRGKANITLEPGGQLELSGAPYAALPDASDELYTHLHELAEVSEGRGIGWLSLGLQPFAAREEIPWMPKSRYRIMREYMPKRGGRGLDMMKKTATVQANLDYESEADAMEKLRVSMAVSPLVTALFANSPLENGILTGWMSTRMSIWLDTDPDRSGLLPFVFDDGCTFQRYVEWALDVPMYLVYRDGAPLDMTSMTFRQFWKQGFQGHHALLEDWKLHLSTLFPEVRLRLGYVEVRGADMGPAEMHLALGALWMGILYSPTARQEAWKLLSTLSFAERNELGVAVARQALAAALPSGEPILPRVRALLRIAASGLKEIGQEIQWLAPLQAIATEGKSAAERLAEAWNSDRNWLTKYAAMR